MSTNVFSQTIIAIWEGPPNHISVEDLNGLIADYNDENEENYRFITDENWPLELTDPGVEDTTLSLENSRDTYAVVKAGNESSLLWVERGEIIEFDKDISGIAIPDTSIIWLLGTSLLLLGLLGRRKKSQN
jgi:hypothetical protein